MYYFYSDPFKVLYHYSDYSYSKVIPNRDYISTQTYINNQNKYNYNSFIFGSSRTLGFKVNSWKKQLDSTANPFVFDASSETLHGIYQKIKFLDDRNSNIDNAIILLCRDCSFLKNIDETRHLIVKHPATSHADRFSFHLSFLKAYFDNKFLIRFLVYQITNNYKPWMHPYIEYRNIKYDQVTNQLSILDQESEISKNQIKYYIQRQVLFYKRKKERVDSVQIINQNDINELFEIKNILAKRRTKYKIILSPLYEQIKINPKDLSILNKIFDGNVLDFTGKNNLTDTCLNYYETSHFRPFIGDSILARIYH